MAHILKSMSAQEFNAAVNDAIFSFAYHVKWGNWPVSVIDEYDNAYKDGEEFYKAVMRENHCRIKREEVMTQRASAKCFYTAASPDFALGYGVACQNILTAAKEIKP
jgi:hypothetical protein